MTTILAIDPGNIESGVTLICGETYHPLRFGKMENQTVLDLINIDSDFASVDHVAIEMIASYGMSVGKSVFDTCVWVGRFQEATLQRTGKLPALVYRQEVKLHHCGQTKATDANITQALIDRFAPDTPNRGKGHKNNPGWFYGFAKDVWQAYALGVCEADRIKGIQGVA